MNHVDALCTVRNPDGKPKCIKKYPSIWCARHAMIISISFLTPARRLRRSGTMVSRWPRTIAQTLYPNMRSVAISQIYIKISLERSHDETNLKREQSNFLATGHDYYGRYEKFNSLWHDVALEACVQAERRSIFDNNSFYL